ncbi:hypothetical protein QVG61_02520 [Thiohalobacter sp. IOR34]|uniref:hypothetical protein n=1 Tax=Thiohalobacter sp. IOR34 TaxID=3057176 RepID=UPI0025B056D3|nr:hypothetical protein [Thiohalobacter sp. IOR34]WJW75984.1 hypothetical protein QVG61_02520 [Thiohalobacter sp. IOR34]
MSHEIRPIEQLEPARLGQLLTENLQRLFGNDARIQPMPTLDTEQCLLIECGRGQCLACFDLQDANRALLNGLIALDQVARETGDDSTPPRLLILSPEPPAGNCLLSQLRGFEWRSCRLLEVDGEPALLIEPAAVPMVTAGPASPCQHPGEKNGEGLSPEESAFFDHL